PTWHRRRDELDLTDRVAARRPDLHAVAPEVCGDHGAAVRDGHATQGVDEAEARGRAGAGVGRLVAVAAEVPDPDRLRRRRDVPYRDPVVASGGDVCRVSVRA